MSNGHGPKDGVKFSGTFLSVTQDGVVSFKTDDPDVISYFADKDGQSFNVTATVAGDAGSTGDLPEAPATES